MTGSATDHAMRVEHAETGERAILAQPYDVRREDLDRLCAEWGWTWEDIGEGWWADGVRAVLIRLAS